MPTYRVLVDDNYHYMDQSERYTFGSFVSKDAAIAASRQIVEDYLASAYTPGMTSAELLSSYKAFGEDPFIISEDSESIQFSAWTYAEKRCNEICTVGPQEDRGTQVIAADASPRQEAPSGLISPELDLKVFCYRVIHNNPLEILDAAATEMWQARRYHHSKTGRKEFRTGSRGQIYCKQLQLLISMITNGQVPPTAPVDFRESVRPLVLQLLKRWEVGSLRNEFHETDA